MLRAGSFIYADGLVDPAEFVLAPGAAIPIEFNPRDWLATDPPTWDWPNRD